MNLTSGILSSSSSTSPVGRLPRSILLLYSRADDRYSESLKKALKAARIDVRDVYKPATHTGFRQSTVQNEINGSEVILMLISADFISECYADDKYAYESELQIAMRLLTEDQKKTAVAVIIRHCTFSGFLSPTNPVLPSTLAKPVSDRSSREAVWMELLDFIRITDEEMTATPSQQDSDDSSASDLFDLLRLGCAYPTRPDWDLMKEFVSQYSADSMSAMLEVAEGKFAQLSPLIFHLFRAFYGKDFFTRKIMRHIKATYGLQTVKYLDQPDAIYRRVLKEQIKSDFSKYFGPSEIAQILEFLDS